MLTREHVQRWLDDYVAAWHSYDPDAIRALFAPDGAPLATARLRSYR